MRVEQERNVRAIHRAGFRAIQWVVEFLPEGTEEYDNLGSYEEDSKGEPMRWHEVQWLVWP